VVKKKIDDGQTKYGNVFPPRKICPQFNNNELKKTTQKLENIFNIIFSPQTGALSFSDWMMSWDKNLPANYG